MSDRYVVVVRKEGATNNGRIYTGRDVRCIAKKIARDFKQRPSRVRWTPEMLAYVDAHYNTPNATARSIAQALSTPEYPITKNAVISKARDRGLTQRRPT